MFGQAQFALICWILLTAAIGSCIKQPAAVPDQRGAPPSSAKKAVPDRLTAAFDLTQVKRFVPRVVAKTGARIAGQGKPVEGIFDWSLNQRGQVAVIAELKSTTGFVDWDLYLIEGERADCLMRQRNEGPRSDRQVGQFFGCELNDRGAALVRILQNEPPGWKLFLINARKIQPLPQSRLLPADYTQGETIAGSQGHVAFVSHERNPRIKPDLFLSDGSQTAPCARAHNDPFDPVRRFRGFGILHSLNARGQLLFEASIRDDKIGPVEQERLCLYTPALTADGKLTLHGESLQGEIRELGRFGDTLPGTDWTVSRDGFGFVELNDSGDVVFSGSESDGMRMGSRCVALLRDGSPRWEILLNADQPFGNPPNDIRFISLPSINARGQVACVVEVVNRQTFDIAVQLLRIEPGGKRTVLAQRGDQLEPGLTMETLFDPRILADGKIVFKAELHSANSAHSSDPALVIADDAHHRLILRESLLPLSRFQQPKLGEFRVNDLGQVAVHVRGDAFENALVLVTPEFSSAVRRE